MASKVKRSATTKATKGKKAAAPKITRSVSLPVAVFDEVSAFAKARGLPLHELVRIAVNSFTARSKLYGLKDKLRFGKYYNEALETIIRLDPNYIEWAMGKVEGFTITDKAQDLLNDIQQPPEEADEC